MFQRWWRQKLSEQKPLSEEQIQAKIHALWKERGYSGNSSEADREKAIATLQAESTNKKWQQFGDKDDREFALKVKQFHWERLKTIISALGLAATIFAGVGLLLTYLNAQKEQQLNTERLITDRFTKAVEQLGHDDIAVRIGGIYALERIAKDSPKDHWTVMEVLTAYVRERSPIQTATARKSAKPVTTDVQSALTAIGRRDVTKDLQGQHLIFYNANLVEADLRGANLQRAVFYGANLGGVFFNGASLQETTFNQANLQGAEFYKANLQKANLVYANLQRASLYRANLKGASLYGANLGGARFDGANLQEAEFNGANLGGARFDGANLQKATFNQANLGGARFDGANLGGAIFDETNLGGAIFNGANLGGARYFEEQQIPQSFFCRTTMPNRTTNNRDCKKLGIPEK